MTSCGRVFDEFRTSFGRVYDEFLTSFGRVADEVWTSFGRCGNDGETTWVIACRRTCLPPAAATRDAASAIGAAQEGIQRRQAKAARKVRIGRQRSTSGQHPVNIRSTSGSTYRSASGRQAVDARSTRGRRMRRRPAVALPYGPTTGRRRLCSIGITSK